MLGVSSRLVSRLPRRAFSAVRGGEGTVVALTGASGYIGSHIAALLVEDGYDVRAIVRDASNDAKCAHLRALGARRAGALTLWEGDLLAPGSFDAAFDGAAAVVHTAAHVELGTGEHIVRASLDGVSHLLASLGKAPSVRRLVHTSSVAAVMHFAAPDGHVFTEADWNEQSTAETDAYGYAKTAAERAVGAFADAAAGRDVVCLNPAVAIGPVFTKPHTKASAVFLRELLYANPMLDAPMTFVDVRDVAAAHVAALTREAAGGRRFVCAGDAPGCGPMRSTELGAVAARLFPALRVAARPKYSPAQLALAKALSRLPVVGPRVMTSHDRQALETVVTFDNRAAKEALGVAFRPLDESVRDGIQSMIDLGFVKPKYRSAA